MTLASSAAGNDSGEGDEGNGVRPAWGETGWMGDWGSTIMVDDRDKGIQEELSESLQGECNGRHAEVRAGHTGPKLRGTIRGFHWWEGGGTAV